MSFITARGDNPYSRYTWIVQTMIQEIFSEMHDVESSTLAAWMEQFGLVLTWCGNGDDSILPDSVKEYLRREHKEMLAIES
jgi:hypothetical protein